MTVSLTSAAFFSPQVWDRLLSRNRLNLERVLRQEGEGEEVQAEPSLRYELHRVVADGEGDEDTGGGWQLVDADWDVIAAAVWAKQSDLFDPVPAANPYLNRVVGDPADLADDTEQHEQGGGSIRGAGGSRSTGATRSTGASSASSASRAASGSATEDDDSDDSSDATKPKPKPKPKRKKPPAGGKKNSTTEPPKKRPKKSGRKSGG